MTENKKEELQTDGDYQFTEDDQLASGVLGDEKSAQATEEAVPAPAAKKTFFLKNKRVLVIAGAVVLVIIIYNFLGGNTTITSNSNTEFTETLQEAPAIKLSPEKSLQQQVNDKKIAELLATPELIAPPAPAAPKPVQHAELPPPPQAVKHGVTQEELQAEVNAQVQKYNQIVNEVAQRLENKMQVMENENGEFRESIHQLTQQITQLQGMIQTLQGDLHKLTESQQRIMYNEGMSFNANGEAKESDIVSEAMIIETPNGNNQTSGAKPRYRVLAAVPGRAWLKTDAGDTMSVTIGDAVPGFGAVVSIDGIDGYVTTSSGITLSNQ